MKARGPNKLQSDRTRARIEGAAIRLFVRQGFHGTTVAEIAAAAGCTGGALYAHFAGKEQLLRHLVERWEREFLEAMVREVLAGREDALGRLHAMISFGAAFTARSPDLSLLLVIVSAEVKDGEGGVGKLLRRLHEAHTGFVRRLVRDGQREGAVDGSFEPGALASMFVGIYDGALLQWQRSGRAREGRALVHALRRLIFHGIEPREPARLRPVKHPRRTRRAFS